MSDFNSWTAHLKRSEDKEKFKASIIESKEVLRVLCTLIESEVEKNEKARLKKEHYNSPNWNLIQADLVGETRAYQEVLRKLKKVLDK